MTENIIFLPQVRDSANTTLDVLLASISAAANAGQNAANTVTLSANNGSVRIANQINFVNSANLKVFVTAGGTGNANVTFDLGVAVSGNPAGSNTWVQFNNQGAFGATANLTYNAATNNTSVNGIFNLNGTNVQSLLNTIYAKANTPSIYANGTIVVANQGNLNFNNTSTINVFVTANGTQTNVAFSVNTSSVQSGSGTITDYSVLATAAQVLFTLTANASSDAYVIVTRNGILQIPGTHYSISANGGGYLNQLTLTSGAEVNDVIDARIFSTSIAQSVVGTPGGANTWVQFNDSGVLGAVTNLLFNKANNALVSTGGSMVINGLDVANTLMATNTAVNAAANTVSVSQNNASTLPARKLNFNNSSSTFPNVTDVGNGTANISWDALVLMPVALSDTNTPITATGLGKGYIRSPKSFILNNVKASLANMSGDGGSPSGTFSIGVRNLGTTVGGGNVLTLTGGTFVANINVRGGALASLGFGGAANGVPVNLSSVPGALTIAEGDMLVFDFNAIGTGAAGVIVYLYGKG